jgi:hypothetical protein
MHTVIKEIKVLSLNFAIKINNNIIPEITINKGIF